MVESLLHHHEDHIAGKGENSLQHYNLVHKFLPLPQALKIPDAKAAVVHECEKLEKIPAWQERSDRWSKEWGQKSTFCAIDGSLSSCEFGARTSVSEIQRSSCTPWWYCKRRFRVLRSIHWTRIISISNDSSWNHGYHFQKARMRRTSSGRSISFVPKKKLKMLTNCWNFSKSECPDIWIRLPRHKWPKSWSNMEDPVVPLERNLYGLLLAGLMGKSIWASSVGTRLGKGLNCEFFVKRARGTFLSVYVDEIKLAGKKQNIDPMWKIFMKDVDLGEPTSFLDHVCLGCTERECQTSKDVVDNYKSMFESTISSGTIEKVPSSRKPYANISSWSYDIEGHAKQCVERYCELANKATQQLQSRNTTHGWPSI